MEIWASAFGLRASGYPLHGIEIVSGLGNRDGERTTTGAEATALVRSDAALEEPIFHGRASSILVRGVIPNRAGNPSGAPALGY